jgi:hypothetical protein
MCFVLDGSLSAADCPQLGDYLIYFFFTRFYFKMPRSLHAELEVKLPISSIGTIT